MKKPSQQKINSEIGKMLRAYDDLIDSPLKHVERWRNYGEFSSCRMCNLMKQGIITTDYMYDTPWMSECRECPIADNGHIISCTAYNNTSINLECMIDEVLQEKYVTNKMIRELKAAAKARYKHILKLLKGNGYVYK